MSATDKKSAQGESVFQISAASTPGNSGGPIITKDAKIDIQDIMIAIKIREAQESKKEE